ESSPHAPQLLTSSPHQRGRAGALLVSSPGSIWGMVEGDDCGKCELALCSEPKDCPAGTVLDRCGCCPECGNCRLDADEARFGEVPEPQCVCKSQESICGPEGKTYENICQFNKAYAAKRNISMKHKGPCESAPVISMPPQDVQNFTGNDVIFGCEVSAYPMPHLEWKKKGNKMFLPGDDAHISARGGPQKYGVTGWLQIQGLKKSDEGIYICHTKNKYGATYASARLKVIDEVPMNSGREKY
uniref:Ovomucoid n=1 Tax=Anser brachyrhynchus TaxID=132585 RepID=A0A8B9CV97_9AVES